MNLSSQNSTNYQTFIGQHYSADMISIANPANYTQDAQLNPVVGYGGGFTSLNEPLKSVNRLSSEPDADENGFDSSDSLLAKLDSTNDSKRQKKLVPLGSTPKTTTSTTSSSSASNAYYNCHYNSQSLTGSSISSNSSSTSSSPLSLSSPLHASNASSLQHYSNHLSLQIKQPIQSQSILANSNTNIINTYSQQTVSSLNQSYMYSDPTSSNIFNYNHSINKFLDSNASLSGSTNDQYSINQSNLSDLAESNLDDFSSSRIKIKKSKKDPITEYDSELAESIEFELGLKKQNGPRKNSWGNLSYAELITRAIESSCDQRLTLSQIYDWIVKYVPYFKEKFDRTSSAGWKNSIRHNLSLHNRFIRVQNESSGKSSWWMINPDVSKYQLNPNLNGNPIPNQMMNNNSNNEASNYIDSSSSNSMLESSLKMNMNDTASMDLSAHNGKLAASLQSQLSYSPSDSAKSTKEIKSLNANRRTTPNSLLVGSSSLKPDHHSSRLSPSSSSSTINYSALSPGLIKNASSSDSSVNAKRNKITKHKLGSSKLNKNNLMYKNKLKLNNKQESQLDSTSSNNNNNNNNNNNTNELKIDNLVNASSASSSATASSSSSLMNDLMLNRMAFSSQANDSLMTASSSAESSTSGASMASLKSTLTASLSAPDQSTPPPLPPPPPPAYSNLGTVNSSSILRAALQKSISASASNCLSNPPTPSATPASSSSMINQSNFNNSPQATTTTTTTKQFTPQANSFIQSNVYNFGNCQADNSSSSSYSNYSSLYPTNSFNTTNSNANSLQFVNLQHQQQQHQTGNNLGYSSPNENVYFSNMNSNQMLVSSPGSSMSTSSSPSSSTSSSSSLTANMTYLNRTNNTSSNNTATTQLLKSKSPLVTEQQLYSSYTLQSQPLNSNQIYSNTFNSQQQQQHQQQQQQSAYDSRSSNLFAPINNSTYYDLSKANSAAGSLGGVSKAESSLVSNHYIDDLSNYQDMLNSSNSNKTTISCYYN